MTDYFFDLLDLVEIIRRGNFLDRFLQTLTGLLSRDLLGASILILDLQRLRKLALAQHLQELVGDCGGILFPFALLGLL